MNDKDHILWGYYLPTIGPTMQCLRCIVPVYLVAMNWSKCLLRRIHLNGTEANTRTVPCAGIVLRSDTGAGKSYGYGYFSAQQYNCERAF